MQLAQLLGEQRTVTIPFGDESLNVVYSPDQFTPELEERYMSMVQTQRSGMALAQIICGLVKKWDLIDNSNNVYPLDVETLSKMPVTFLNAVVDAVNNDIMPKKTNAKRSNNGSFQAD